MSDTEFLVKSGALKNLTWTKGGYKGPLYTAEYEGKVVEVRPTSSVTYKLDGRLRDVKGTRHTYRLEVSVEGSLPFVFNPGAVVGETKDADERCSKKKEKVAAFAKKNLGLEVGEFDYRYF